MPRIDTRIEERRRRQMRDDRLKALDPDLPLLASEAAIDIENMLSNRSRDMTAMKNLAERLNKSIEFSAAGKRSLMDPVTLSILGEAMREAMKNQTLRNVEDLLSEAAKVAKLLSSDTPTENPGELEKAKDFCIALSKAVIVYHKSITDLGP